MIINLINLYNYNYHNSLIFQYIYLDKNNKKNICEIDINNIILDDLVDFITPFSLKRCNRTEEIIRNLSAFKNTN